MALLGLKFILISESSRTAEEIGWFIWTSLTALGCYTERPQAESLDNLGDSSPVRRRRGMKFMKRSKKKGFRTVANSSAEGSFPGVRFNKPGAQGVQRSVSNKELKAQKKERRKSLELKKKGGKYKNIEISEPQFQSLRVAASTPKLKVTDLDWTDSTQSS